MSLGFLTPSSLSAWPIIYLHLVFSPIPEEPLRWVVLLASLLNFILFWAVPPSPEPVATLYTTCSSKKSQLSALFWLSKTKNIAEMLVILNSLNGCETISTQYTFTPFLGWDRLFTKKEYFSLSRLRGSLGWCFLPFRIWETIYKKGLAGVLFSTSFQTL